MVAYLVDRPHPGAGGADAVIHVLGIDPGTSYCGWCCLEGTRLIRRGVVDISGKHPWPVKRRAAEQAFAEIVRNLRPDLVAIEKTQAAPPKEGDTPGRVFSMAVLTQHTEELSGLLQVLATGAGAGIVRVSPAGSLAALSCKRGAKDRQVAEAFTRLFGEKCLVKDHHVARAAGVALRGEVEWRLQQAKAQRMAVIA